MKATLVLQASETLTNTRSAYLVVWEVPEPVRGSTHHYKYRLVIVEDDVCLLRYDNEAGKGDHKPIGALEMPYQFSTIEQLLLDFWADEARL